MLYDYKSKYTVQDVILDSIEKLTYDIEDEFSSLRRYQYLIIYSPAFLAREIIGEILDDEDDTWVNEDAHFELLHDDDNEVLITLAYDGMVFIEEARGDNGELKISDFSALTYVYDGFSKRDVDCLTSEGESVLVFGFDDGVLDDEYGYEINGVKTTKEVFDRYLNTYIKNNTNEDSDDDDEEDPCEECCNDCNCFCDEDEDGNVHGFTVSKTDDNGYMSCSYYSSEGFDEDDMRDILELLGYRFKD